MAKKDGTKGDLFRELPKYPHKKLLMSLPMPISINHAYVNTHNGGKVLNARAENYMRTAKALVNMAIEDNGWIRQRNSTWYYIDLVFYLEDRRKRDSHNLIKLLLDMMEGIAYENDYYVMPRIQAVEYDPLNPRVMVYMTPQKQSEREKWLRLIG